MKQAGQKPECQTRNRQNIKMRFFDRDRPGIFPTGLSLFFFHIAIRHACLLAFLFMPLLCLILSCLSDQGFAADSSVRAKASPVGQGKLAISSGKNGSYPKNTTQKNVAAKSNVKSATQKNQTRPEPSSGPAWKFGKGKSGRKVAAENWQRGLSSASLRKRAIANRKEPLPEVTEEDMIVNPLFPKGKKKSAFSLGFEHEGSSWNNGPSVNMHNPGEDYLMEGRNVIRGTRSVKAGKNLNIDLGPELILKDQKARESLNNSNQPDSLLGIGMQFKFGF